MTRTEPSTRAVSPEVSAATRATYIAFIGSGFAFASWASRIPQVRTRLDLDPAALGLVLLAIAAGSVVALPLAGPVIARLAVRASSAGVARLVSAVVTVRPVPRWWGVRPGR